LVATIYTRLVIICKTQFHEIRECSHFVPGTLSTKAALLTHDSMSSRLGQEASTPVLGRRDKKLKYVHDSSVHAAKIAKQIPI